MQVEAELGAKIRSRVSSLATALLLLTLKLLRLDPAAEN